MSALRIDCQVDILIRGWGNIPMTRRLIKSILANTPAPAYQIIYVDNGSPRNDLASLMFDFPQVTVIALPFNHGSVRAINLGLAHALMSTAPYIVLLDNDTEIPKGDKTWLERFLAPMLGNDLVGAVGAVSNYVTGHQHCELLPDIFQKAWADKGNEGMDEMPAFPFLVSFAMALRKTAVKTCGLFDERFEPGNAEDYDYTLRLLEKGLYATIAPSVWIHHKGSQTFQRFDFPQLIKTNMDKLVNKWGQEKLAALGVQVA